MLCSNKPFHGRILMTIPKHIRLQIADSAQNLADYVRSKGDTADPIVIRSQIKLLQIRMLRFHEESVTAK